MSESPNANVVTMSDGSTIDFGAKKRLVKTVTVSDQGSVTIDLAFRNGEQRRFIAMADAATYAQAAAHGYSQKLGDECAGLKDESDMVQAIDELIVRLDQGEWSGRREGGAGAGGSILARALVELTQKPEETIEQARERVKTFLASKTQAEKIALRGNLRLKPIIERLEAEKVDRSGKGVDSDALLDELE